MCRKDPNEVNTIACSIFVLAWIVLLLMAAGICQRAHGQESSAAAMMPAREPAAESLGNDGGGLDGLQLGRACWLESGWSFADCAAIGGVVRARAARAGVPFRVMLMRYSALHKSTARAILARRLPDGDEETWSAKENQRWSKLRSMAEGIVKGDVASPCASASHWAGSGIGGDRMRITRAVAAGRLEIVVCDVPTKNTFLRDRLTVGHLPVKQGDAGSNPALGTIAKSATTADSPRGDLSRKATDCRGSHCRNDSTEGAN